MTDIAERRSQLTPLQRALLALQEAQAQLDEQREGRTAPIAVIGMACRLPGGVNSPEALWTLLRERGDAVGEVPANRWDVEAYYDPNPGAPGKSYCRHGAFLEDVDGFDAALFGITPREATYMDPQQRLLLEVSWEALERANLAPDRMVGRPIGAFVGISTSDYLQRAVKHCDTTSVNAYAGTGNAHSIAANRLSYALGLEGPSIAVDTACSSSLVAVHLACAALRGQECELALVGGVNLMLLAETMVNFAQARMLSPSGRSATFDASADGYIRGEGCGVVVLKPLSAARTDGDRVLAVIRGSAVNQDGRSNGLTAPNGLSQEQVVRRALRQAGAEPAELGYVEAHGTGTILGDPIELAALGRVLAPAGGEPTLVGSLKANIGHLEAAAGIAGLIKSVLVLEHGVVPPQPHFTHPNPHVDWETLPLRVTTEPAPLLDGRRLVGVSSFGFGGTNAHVILEAAPAVATVPAAPATPAGEREAFLIKLAARGPESLSAVAGRLRRAVEQDGAMPLAAIAHAAGVGRADLPHRAAVVAVSRDNLREQLDALVAGDPSIRVGRVGDGDRPRTAFLIPGQGQGLAGAGTDLYRQERSAARRLDELAEVLGPIDALPLAVLLEGSSDAKSALTQTEVAQPALYALALALAAWWEDAGIQVDALLGHSVGAYAAAALAGVFTTADGARLVAARGRLMGDLPAGGAMAAVIAPPEVMAPLVADAPGVTVAAYNGAREVVVAGAEPDVDRLCNALSERRIHTQRLAVAHAFHSPLIEPALAGLERELAVIDFHPPARRLISDTTGAAAGEEVASPDYWIRHARLPVRFSDALDTLGTLGLHHLIELGPGSTMLGLARRHPATDALTPLPSLSPRRPATVQLLSSLGHAFTEGAPVRWTRVTPPAGAHVALPTYPFERRRFWLPERADTPDGGRAPTEQPAPQGDAGMTDAARSAPGLVDAVRAAGPEARSAMVLGHVCRQLAEVIGLDPGEPIDPDTGLFELGLDSLMALELQRRLERAFALELPVTVALDYPTAAMLAERLTAAVTGVARPAATVRADRGRSLTDARERDDGDDCHPVAIVGMACRFPGGADDLDSYWRILRDGVDTIGPIPPDRWDADAFFDADPNAPMRATTRSGGFLQGRVGEFDADMFGISPREAAAMDPQQRLLLEVGWEALEDAGAEGALVGSRTGVFIGINTSDYMQLLAADPAAGIDAYAATGNTFSIAAGRLSYLLGLRGPSLAIDTACSSSLVALHMACRSLREGESDAALAGGVNLMLSPATTIGMAKLRALSPDGRCKTFDAAADGYGRGEGCGVLVLKRLSDALASEDRVWAVVRGSAVNHDGRSAGLTVPSGPAQVAVIVDALRDARSDPAAVSYVEAHGTGTELGDPIELRALAASLSSDRQRPLCVGSVKTNLGHLEAAAGVAGVIKIALAMRHGSIPAHLHLRSPTPLVPWAELGIQVPAQTIPWEARDSPRLAGVSSFGFSGTNAHVILEEAPQPRPSASDEARPPDLTPASADCAELLVLSARSDGALRAAAARVADLLAGPSPGPRLRDVAFTAASRRAHHNRRLAVVAGDAAEASDRLTAFAANGRDTRVRSGVAATEVPPVVFVFCGQGAQWVGMGRSFLVHDPTFATVLERIDAIVRREVGWSPIEELRGQPRLADTAIAQPLLFAIQAGQAAMWREWGVVPAAVIGHSVGEIAAAHTAGALTLEDALRIVLCRAELMQSTKGHGAMAAIGLAPEAVGDLMATLAHPPSIAAVNAPEITVISGDRAAVAAAVARARERAAFARLLPVEYAFHSSQMAPLRARLTKELASLTPRVPAIPIMSTVTGAPADSGGLGAEHWAANMCDPVRFRDAVGQATRVGDTTLIEIGPHPVLASAIASCLAADNVLGTTLATARADVDDERSVALDALGALHVAGASVDLGATFPPDARVVTLPTYAWQRRRYWLPRSLHPSVTSLAARSASDPTATTDPGAALAEMTHELTWHPRPRPESTASEGVGRGRWILLGDDKVLTEQVAAHLHHQGDTCIRGPWEPQLLDVAPARLPLRGILHFWAAPEAMDAEAMTDAARRECGLLLETLRALAAAPPGDAASARIWVVTRGTQPASPDQATPDPTHAPVWGLARVAALEHPELWGGIIDLAAAADSTDASAVITELRGADLEDQIAYRNGTRLVVRLTPAALDRPAARLALRPDASYLITGGRGALGLQVAAWLAQHGARHLILTGRSQPGPGARNAVARLESQGVRVEAAIADVGDAAAMASLLTASAAGRPPVRGVVHAAGVFAPRALLELSPEELDAVLAPKVRGTWLLHELTRELELDFLVMFSSGASVWGSAFAGHYAAANHFQDIVAHHRHQLGLPAVTVNWGWWDGSEMVSNEARAYFSALGLSEVPANLGLLALERLILAGQPQRTIAPIDWSRFAPAFSAKRPRRLLDLVQVGATQSVGAASAAGQERIDSWRHAAAENRHALVVEYLQAEIGGVLGRAASDPIDPERGFFESGMDSITTVELKTRLESALGIALPTTIAFERPNAAALADYLLTDALALTHDAADDSASPACEVSPDALAGLDENELLELLERELETAT